MSIPPAVRRAFGEVACHSRSANRLLLDPRPWRRSSDSSRRHYASVAASELQFGQPLHETHPHILKAGEVTPGITALEYAERRSRLASKLPDRSVAVIAASSVKYRSGSVFYDFHQDSDFFYLTGFNEPEAAAVIERNGPGGEHTFHLFVRPKDPKAELWDGARSGTQAALDVFNADESRDIAELDVRLPDMVAEAAEIYTDFSPESRNRSAFGRFFSSSTTTKGFAKILDSAQVKPLRPLLNDLRVTKSDSEITNMRRAGRYSGRAFTGAMGQHFDFEKDLAAFLEHRFKSHGCDGTAYVPVVAGGKNGLSIHYVRNDNVLRRGDLVLTDAGGEYGGYITDITRTWPVTGRFLPAQRELYQAILNVQRTCVALCRENAGVSLDKLHEIAESGLRDQLKQLGFDMSGNALEVLFPHHVGHHIGLDVHDTPGYARTGRLTSGQCITIEPGIYVTDDDRWPEHFRGMGIRIEDSVCVQDESPLVLTTEAVKEVVDIEALRE
ncbi:MAG: hypothetical protein M1817_003203 [Caeruleum heppii]|nr:MAG: hypothetical protein M1817_003203 [Caeruleum heppii]